MRLEAIKSQLLYCLVAASVILISNAGPLAAVTGSKPPFDREIRDRSTYHPIHRDYWDQVAALIDQKKPELIFSLKFALLPKVKTGLQRADSGDAEKDEWKLGLARAMVAAGQPIHAQYLLTQIATKSVGTAQGLEALHAIHEIARAGPVDEGYLEELAFDLDVKAEEPQVRSLIAYYRARSLLRKGYTHWAVQALEEVADNTTWSEELAYDRAQQMLSGGDSAGAYAQFESISQNPETRVPTTQMAKLALGRLIFERRDFKAATSILTSTELPLRERVRALNDLAWSEYYDRSYGKSLGVIGALKSPYFQVLMSPETYVLEMLIYRELCHYSRVQDLASQFLEHYKVVFSNMEKREGLEKLPQFLQMALQEGVMQRRAGAIQEVRLERRELESQHWRDGDLQSSLRAFGQKRERIVDAEITRMLRSRIDNLANWFLDLREQVWFLQYETSLRRIQMSSGSTESPSPLRTHKSQADLLFWPVNDEAWRDELMNYEVLIDDACPSTMQGGTMQRGRQLPAGERR